MKNSDFASIVVYLLMFVVALFIGLQLIQPANNALGNDSLTAQYTFAIAVIVVGLIINVVLFELGHVIGALIGGYVVMSVNILGLALYRGSNNKFKFGIKKFHGLTGETKIRARSEKANPRFFLFGPTILTLVEFAVAVILFLSLPDKTLVQQSSLIVAGIGALLLVYNIMPFKLDTLTDGYQIIMLTKKINVLAYNEMMKIEALAYENSDGEITIKADELTTYDVITNMTSKVNLYKVYLYIDEKKYNDALALIDNLIENKNHLEEEVLGQALTQKLYIILKTLPREAAEIYFMGLSQKDRKFITNDLSLETLRTYLVYAGSVDKSENEVYYILNKVNKAIRNRQDEVRKTKEVEMFVSEFDFIKANNPDWKITLPFQISK